jgi:cytochrome c553
MPLMRLLLAALVAVPLGVLAAEDDDDDKVDLLDMEPDRAAGEVMFRQCALCHGQHGQGHSRRQVSAHRRPADLLHAERTEDYRTGERGYDAMLVVGGLKTADDQDLVNLAAYVSDLEGESRRAGPRGWQRAQRQAALQGRLQDLSRPQGRGQDAQGVAAAARSVPRVPDAADRAVQIRRAHPRRRPGGRDLRRLRGRGSARHPRLHRVARRRRRRKKRTTTTISRQRSGGLSGRRARQTAAARRPRPGPNPGPTADDLPRSRTPCPIP